jgi:phospholipase C
MFADEIISSRISFLSNAKMKIYISLSTDRILLDSFHKKMYYLTKKNRKYYILIRVYFQKY